MAILALDLGRCNRWTQGVCLDPLTGEIQDLRFRTTVPALLEAVSQHPAAHVVCEISPTVGLLHDALRERGISCTVVNANGSHWRWSNRTAKTDRKDALMLAKLAAVGDLRPVHVPSASVRAHRALIAERDQLVEDLRRVKQRIRALLETQHQSLAAGTTAWSASAIAQLWSIAEAGNDLWQRTLRRQLDQLAFLQEQRRQTETDLAERASQDPRIALLQTQPGVGPRVAEEVVATIDDPHRFRTAKQLGAYAGLVPRVYQSGDTHRHGRITRAGKGRLRAKLIQAAWAAVRYNPLMEALFHRICGGSKARRKQAIVAVARRILVTAWAQLKHATPYQPA